LKVLVGAGGWEYFPTLEEDKLRAYAKRFRFVEVNSTFYRVPKLATVRSWRRRVPRDFVFSVKCNRIATHDCELEPVDETFRALKRMFMVCTLLRSEMLVLQTPSSLRVDEDKVEVVSTMLDNLNPGQVQLFWETRTPWPAEVVKKVRGVMVEKGIIPVVDLSREDPVPGTKVVYSRLFSRGELLYGNEVLEKIDGHVSDSIAERFVLTFHGTSMYRDAARYIDMKSH
jgi:uncharacterized protein YecE (DUF72 family)